MPSFAESKRKRDNALQSEALQTKIACVYKEVIASSVTPADLLEGLCKLAKLGLLDFFKRQRPSIITELAKHSAPIQACSGLIAMYELELFRYGSRQEDRANLEAVMQAQPQNNAAKGVAGLLFILKKNAILTAANRKKILAHAKPWELYSAWINDFGSVLLTLKTPNAQWVFDQVAAHTAPQEALILLLSLAQLGLVNDPVTAQQNMRVALCCKAPAMLTKAVNHLKKMGLCSESKGFAETLKTLSFAENPWDVALEIFENTQATRSPVAGGLTSFGLLSSKPLAAKADQLIHEKTNFKSASLCPIL